MNQRKEVAFDEIDLNYILETVRFFRRNAKLTSDEWEMYANPLVDIEARICKELAGDK
jgi:hypothetical protein